MTPCAAIGIRSLGDDGILWVAEPKSRGGVNRVQAFTAWSEICAEPAGDYTDLPVGVRDARGG